MHPREKVFFILSSVFVTALVMANLIGITKFFEFTVPLTTYHVMVPVGIIPYPLTFLATDLLSELYGRRRANFVVLVGFLMNVLLIFICWIGDVVPASPDWHVTLSEPWHANVYPRIWTMLRIGVFGSMVAYLVAQLVDVQLFHYWKRVTKGKHLWLRNNASTMTSQLIDSSIILTIVFYEPLVEGKLTATSPWSGEAVYGGAALGVHILNAYLFKLVFAAADTPFAYLFRALLQPIVGTLDEDEIAAEAKEASLVEEVEDDSSGALTA